MADYTLVRLDDNIGNKAVLAYDAVNDMLVDSGMTGHQGELQANAGTVSVGLQDMSSAGEQVVWRNKDSKVNYAPPWHVIDEVNPGGSYDRLYEPLQTVTRFAVRTDVLENPKFSVYIPIEEVVFQLNMTFPDAHKDVQFMITHAGQEMWREVKDVSAGVNDIVLDIPIAFHPGTYEFSIKPYITPGIGPDTVPPVKVMGEAQTGKVGYDVKFREFRDVPLATQEYVISAVTGGPADDVMLKSVYDKGNNGKVDVSHITDKVRGVDSAVANSYYGKDSSGNIGFYPLPAAADEAALQASIKKAQDQADANKIEIAKHETAIEGHGTQLAAHANSIATNTNNIQIAMEHSQSALDESNAVRKNGVNAVVAEVSNTHKTITLKLMSSSGLVDTALIDLSGWFTSVPPQPGSDHRIYYGFTVNPPLDESTLLRIGTSKEVPSIDSLDITITRSDQSSSFMWVWLPDAAGTVRGFDFSGFVSVWGSVALTVAGVPGKFYTSPNKTSATSVEFEVRV